MSPKETLIAIQTSTGVSAVKEIRSLLTSQDYDSLYIFLCCLSSVDPDLWAGTTPEIPPVLEGWEVERIMTLLDCDDKLIRKQASIVGSVQKIFADSPDRPCGPYGVSTERLSRIITLGHYKAIFLPHLFQARKERTF